MNHALLRAQARDLLAAANAPKATGPDELERWLDAIVFFKEGETLAANDPAADDIDDGAIRRNIAQSRDPGEWAEELEIQADAARYRWLPTWPLWGEAINTAVENLDGSAASKETLDALIDAKRQGMAA